MNRRELIAAIAALRGAGRDSPFAKIQTKARMGRNPATGEAIKIKASKKARITALKGFKDIVLGAAPAPKLTKASPTKAAPTKKAAPARTASKTTARTAASRTTASRAAAAKRATAAKAPATRTRATKAATTRRAPGRSTTKR